MSSVSVYTPWGLYLKRSTMIHMTNSRVLGLNNLEKSKCVLRHSSFAWQCHTHCFSLHYGCQLSNTWNNDFPPSSLPSSKPWQGIVDWDWGHHCLLWLLFRVSCCPHSIEHRLHTYIFPASILQEKALVSKKKQRHRKEKEEERERLEANKDHVVPVMLTLRWGRVVGGGVGVAWHRTSKTPSSPSLLTILELQLRNSKEEEALLQQSFDPK